MQTNDLPSPSEQDAVSRLLGAVLAGGRARRFGSDKAVALYAGMPMIAHAVAALRPQVASVVVCGGAPRLERERTIPDRPAADLGPLGGLNAALHHAAAGGFDAVVTVGCDMPVLPSDLAARLERAGACVVLAGMPLVGLWPVALAPLLDLHLESKGDRSMSGWATLARAVTLDLGSVPANVNTQHDLLALETHRSAGERRPVR